jgi:inner membrane transporter RhtA
MTDGRLLRGVAATLTSGASNQVGAALGAHAFPAIGPAGVVAVRQAVAAVALLLIARPPIRSFDRTQRTLVVLLALDIAVMNLTLYAAIERIGLGLAVTLEFLGPLGVALVASRTRADLVIAMGAGVGVYVLVLPDGSSDLVGIALALVAACCWAAYIVLNRAAGARLPGLQAPAAATSIAALLYLPVLLVLGAQGLLTGPPLLYALAAGLLASAVPYALDVVILRSLPPRLFGVLQSAQPGIAALAGLVLLAQVPEPHEWAGIAIVAGANVLAVLLADQRRRATLAALPGSDEIRPPGSAGRPGPLSRSLPRG